MFLLAFPLTAAFFALIGAVVFHAPELWTLVWSPDFHLLHAQVSLPGSLLAVSMAPEWGIVAGPQPALDLFSGGQLNLTSLIAADVRLLNFVLFAATLNMGTLVLLLFAALSLALDALDYLVARPLVWLYMRRKGAR